MRDQFLLFMFLTSNLTVVAALAEASDTPEIAIMSVDGGHEVQGMDPQIFATFHREKKSKILPPAERDRQFQKASIEASDLEGMDQLDRDLLYLNSTSRQLDDLCARYPRISRAKLLRLTQQVHAKK